MTRREAKKELQPIKDMEADIRAVELEIERLMTLATKMTTNYTPINVTSTPGNRLEDALIKAEEYRGRLSNLLIDSVRYKTKCLEKVNQIQTRTLRTLLILYFFQDMTIEKTAEVINKTPRWTYELLGDALDAYAKIS